MNATLYTYHGIQYTYADLQRAYIRRLEATEKAIDAEQYAKASEIIRTDVREYLPQIVDEQPKPKPKPKRKSKLIRILYRLLK